MKLTPGGSEEPSHAAAHESSSSFAENLNSNCASGGDLQSMELAAFLAQQLVGLDEADDITRMVRLYHAVRTIPYGSTGDRSPLVVIRNRVGSCSGKHILLRELLRGAAINADVLTIRTYFSQGIPAHPSMPQRLQTLLKGEPVMDFHHYVCVSIGGRRLKLDATWHDAMAVYGIPTNKGWAGTKDTRLAAEALQEFPPVEDVSALKLELLASLDATVRARRLEFFALLTAWIASFKKP